ncbi:MAG: hypothetical protein PVJ81_02085 [Dehalococcoidia bacterium]
MASTFSSASTALSIWRQLSKLSEVQATSIGLDTAFSDDDSLFSLRCVVGVN